jgi:hypothetical protein
MVASIGHSVGRISRRRIKCIGQEVISWSISSQETSTLASPVIRVPIGALEEAAVGVLVIVVAVPILRVVFMQRVFLRVDILSQVGLSLHMVRRGKLALIFQGRRLARGHEIQRAVRARHVMPFRYRT